MCEGREIVFRIVGLNFRLFFFCGCHVEIYALKYKDVPVHIMKV